MNALWDSCLESLQEELTEQQYETWIRPLHVKFITDTDIVLYAPNHFILEWVKETLLKRITVTLTEATGHAELKLSLKVGTVPAPGARSQGGSASLNPDYRFDTFIPGTVNRAAKDVVMAAAERPAGKHNPLFLYGAEGLGKTHLVHAAGNALLARHPEKRVGYVRAAQFSEDLTKAVDKGTQADFIDHYRALDLVILDNMEHYVDTDHNSDKEEFLSLFSTLFERQRQLIIASRRRPHGVVAIERLLRAAWSGAGCSLILHPPDRQARLDILKLRSEKAQLALPADVAGFIASRFAVNIKILNSALLRVFTAIELAGGEIDLPLARSALGDLLPMNRTPPSIQEVIELVADYHDLSVSDLTSKKRLASYAKPRQLAIALLRELTRYSMHDISQAFGGVRKATTAHAHSTILAKTKTDPLLAADFDNLKGILDSYT